MTRIGLTEAKTRFPELLERVARGEKITITRQGKPVALLVPAEPESSPDIKNVIEEFKAYSKERGRTLGGLTFREMIDQGRH